MHKMRYFHYNYQEVVDNMGASPEDLLPILDACRRSAWTERDYAHLAVLEEMLTEFYGITEEGWEEWR